MSRVERIAKRRCLKANGQLTGKVRGEFVVHAPFSLSGMVKNLFGGLKGKTQKQKDKKQEGRVVKK
jgi:hypothetical protein